MSSCPTKIYHREFLLIIITDILLVCLSFVQKCNATMPTGTSRSQLKCMLPFTHISVQWRPGPSCCLCALKLTSSSLSLLLFSVKQLFCRWPITRVSRPRPWGNAAPVASLKACCQTWSISKPSYVIPSLQKSWHLSHKLKHLPLVSAHSTPTPSLPHPTHTHRVFCHSAEMSM